MTMSVGGCCVKPNQAQEQKVVTVQKGVAGGIPDAYRQDENVWCHGRQSARGLQSLPVARLLALMPQVVMSFRPALRRAPPGPVARLARC